MFVSPMGTAMGYCLPASKERKAVRSGNLYLLKILVRDRFELNKPDGRGWTLLHEAAANDKLLDIAEFLILAGSTVDLKTPGAGTPLYIACKHGCEEMAKLFLAAGCNVNVTVDTDYFGYKHCLNSTPLHMACYQGNLAIIKLLVENNANVNTKDGWGRTPIYYAIHNLNAPAVRVLTEAGTRLKMKDTRGYTPLHYACVMGNLELFNILIQQLGCDKSALDEKIPDGSTPLMLACNLQHYVIVERLIECGADTTVVNCIGILALHMAAGGELDLFKLVLQHTPKDAIEKCATFKSDFHCYRSIPCVIIDNKAFENLVLFYQCGVSEAVLKCPSLINGHLISPIGHLLLVNNTWLDNETRLKFLEFLLSYEFLIDPIYGEENNPPSTISTFEAVVQMHEPFNEDCCCDTFLSLILSKVSSPHKGLPRESSKQVSLFNKAARDGFVLALDLLKYAVYIEPDDVLETFLNDILEPQYQWTGNECLVVKFLREKCITSFVPKLLKIEKSIRDSDYEDRIKRLTLVSIHNEIKFNNRVISLKRMCRFVLRKQIREQAIASSQPYRRFLQNILLPPFISRYLLYEMDF